MNDLLTWATKTHKKDNVLVMAEQYRDGISLDGIGEKFRCTSNTIRNKLREYLPTEQQISDFKRAHVAAQINKLKVTNGIAEDLLDKLAALGGLECWEIGEGEPEVTHDKEWFKCCVESPEHDTRIVESVRNTIEVAA